MKNSKIYKKLSQAMNKKIGGDKMYKTIISLGLLIPTLLYLGLLFRISYIQFLNYMELFFVFLPIFLTGLIIDNVFRNKIQLSRFHSLNEHKILENKQYLILLFGLFGLYLLYFKGLFSIETSTDLVFIVTIYSFGAVISICIISEILLFFNKLLKNKEHKKSEYVLLPYLIMYLFFITIINIVFIESGEFINNRLFVIIILGIFISLNLIKLLNNSEKYELYVNGLLSFSIVLLIFQHIPSNYVIGGLGKVEGGIIIEKEDVLDYYNDVKYSKNNLNNDRDKSENQTFFNPKEIYYSKVLDIYFANFTLLFEDSKYYYGSLDGNQGVVLDTIKIKKAKYTFKEGIFNTEYYGDNSKQNSITIGYDITGIYGNILNSHSYNLTHIYETVLGEHLSQITLVDDKISNKDIKKLFIELESLYLLDINNLIKNENFNDLFNDAKDIFKGNEDNLDKINKKLGKDQKITYLPYLTGNYSSDLLNSGLDKNYGYFLELIVLLSNKLNNKEFVNDTGKKYWINDTFQDLEECLYHNKCSEGKFNFDETGFFSKQNLKSRYGFILQGFKSWGNKYDLQLLKYISGESKVEKY